MQGCGQVRNNTEAGALPRRRFAALLSKSSPLWVAGTFPDATRTQSGPGLVMAGCSGNNKERGG